MCSAEGRNDQDPEANTPIDNMSSIEGDNVDDVDPPAYGTIDSAALPVRNSRPRTEAVYDMLTETWRIEDVDDDPHRGRALRNFGIFLVGGAICWYLPYSMACHSMENMPCRRA